MPRDLPRVGLIITACDGPLARHAGGAAIGLVGGLDGRVRNGKGGLGIHSLRHIYFVLRRGRNDAVDWDYLSFNLARLSILP